MRGVGSENPQSCALTVAGGRGRGDRRFVRGGGIKQVALARHDTGDGVLEACAHRVGDAQGAALGRGGGVGICDTGVPVAPECIREGSTAGACEIRQPVDPSTIQPPFNAVARTRALWRPGEPSALAWDAPGGGGLGGGGLGGG